MTIKIFDLMCAASSVPNEHAQSPTARAFLSDTSELRTDDLMILRMRVIFQADEKHAIQVFC